MHEIIILNILYIVILQITKDFKFAPYFLENFSFRENNIFVKYPVLCTPNC